LKEASSVIFSIVLILFSLPSLGEEKLQFFTEEFPPYNFQDQDNNDIIKGLSMDVVNEIVRRVEDHPVDIKLYPWLRAYSLAKNTPNTAIFSIGRNAKREELFHWIGVIAPAKFYLFSLQSRSDMVIENLEASKQYTVGTFPKSVREQYLLENGFEPDRVKTRIQARKGPESVIASVLRLSIAPARSFLF